MARFDDRGALMQRLLRRQTPLRAFAGIGESSTLSFEDGSFSAQRMQARDGYRHPSLNVVDTPMRS